LETLVKARVWYEVKWTFVGVAIKIIRDIIPHWKQLIKDKRAWVKKFINDNITHLRFSVWLIWRAVALDIQWSFPQLNIQRMYQSNRPRAYQQIFFKLDQFGQFMVYSRPDFFIWWYAMYCEKQQREGYIYLLSREAWRLWLGGCTDHLLSKQAWLAIVDNPFPLSQEGAKVRCDRIPLNLFLNTNQRLSFVRRELATALPSGVHSHKYLLLWLNLSSWDILYPRVQLSTLVPNVAGLVTRRKSSGRYH